jgi:hypothetical protein
MATSSRPLIFALMGESQAQEKAYVKRPATPMTGR